MSDERTEREPVHDRDAANTCPQDPAPSTANPTRAITEPVPLGERTQPNPPKPDGAPTARQTDSGAKKSLKLSQQTFVVPGYAAVRHLGTGTYGVVWLAEHTKSKKRVAVKFFTAGAGQDWQLLQAEVKQLAAMNADPGIVELIDADLEAPHPYFIMRYCEGGSLADRLEKGPLSVAEALPLFSQICEALAYVHVKGIRHCDLKPGNVLLDARGRALLADFGQAHLSDDASPALGTFFYMAPEQADLTRQIADTRWDVYGLGALLYAMLTGKPPRDDGTLRAVLQKTARLSHRLELYREKLAQAEPLTKHRHIKGIDADLVTIMDRCLHVDPNRRPRDAGDVARLLRRRERRRRQKPVVVTALLAPVVLVLLMFGSIAYLFNHAQQQVHDETRKHEGEIHQRNAFIARLVAADVRQKIDERVILLDDEIHKHPDLAGLIKAAALHDCRQEHADLKRWLAAVPCKVPAKAGRTSNPGPIYWEYMWVTRADGKILAIRKNDDTDEFKTVADVSFAFRDWFHGEGDLAKDKRRPMLTRIYASEPYVTTMKSQPLVFAISMPVLDRNNTAVGLVTLSVRIDMLNEWFKQLDVHDGFAVLFNDRYQYLLHPFSDEIKKLDANKKIRKLAEKLPPAQAVFAQEKSGAVEEPFHDPLYTDKTYVACYAPVVGGKAKLNWGVAIQTASDYDGPALRQMRETFRSTALIGGIVVGVLLPLLWIWLVLVLRRQEGLAWH